MPIPSFQIALKIRNEIRVNPHKLNSATAAFLPVDDNFDEFIKDLGLSAAEQASCEHDRLAQAINTFAWDDRKHEDPDFKDVYILLRILVTIQSPHDQRETDELEDATDEKIKVFLQLFTTGASAEQFLIIFHTNPGISLKETLPLTGVLLQAVEQINLISANVNFDILVDQFISASAEVTSEQGFVFGGVNSTQAIKELRGFKINDNLIYIPALEARMRPQRYSVAGFIDARESLIDVLVRDNACVVDEQKMTHQMLAAPLLAIMYIFDNNQSLPRAYRPASLKFMLRGNNFEVSYMGTLGEQASPFQDGLAGSKDFEIKNIDNGKSIKFGELVPKLIDRYGFYEGNTSYRVEPRVILDVFDCLFPKQEVTHAPQTDRTNRCCAYC